MSHVANTGGLYVTGLAHAYPPHSYGPEQFEDIIQKLYPNWSTTPGLQKLVQFNRKTRINSRPIITDFSKWTKDDATPPTINELSRSFRTVGVDLASSACNKAIQEACLSAADITHLVAVTCTDQGNPGYDLLVCQKLKLSPSVQRVLLHGVGCAGGLSALRAAADIAASESQLGRPARVLVIACELCSLFLRTELQAASLDDALHIAPALFSDAAAAAVVSNGLAVNDGQMPIFQLQKWGSMIVPGTLDHMSYETQSNGMIATMSKEVPKTAIGAIAPMLDQLCNTSGRNNCDTTAYLNPSTSDWAIHPGGAAILRGAQQAFSLTDDHIRASLDVYGSYGNSSSPTVLIVLDKLRQMGQGRKNVIATSFGPGMVIEMFLLKRCEPSDEVQTPRPKSRQHNATLLALQSRLTRWRHGLRWHTVRTG